jgi:hypothetical protein
VVVRVGCLLKKGGAELIEDVSVAIDECRGKYMQNTVYIDKYGRYFVVKKKKHKAYKYYVDDEALNELHRQKLLLRNYRFKMVNGKRSKTYTVTAEDTVLALKAAFSKYFNTKLVRVTSVDYAGYDGFTKRFTISGEIIIDRDNDFIVFHDYEVRKLCEMYDVIKVYKFFAEYELYTTTKRARASGRILDTAYSFEIVKLSPL